MNHHALERVRALACRSVPEEPAKALGEIANAAAQLREVCRLPHEDEPVHAALATLIGQLALTLGQVVAKLEAK